MDFMTTRSLHLTNNSILKSLISAFRNANFASVLHSWKFWKSFLVFICIIDVRNGTPSTLAWITIGSRSTSIRVLVNKTIGILSLSVWMESDLKLNDQSSERSVSMISIKRCMIHCPSTWIHEDAWILKSAFSSLRIHFVAEQSVGHHKVF